MKGNCFVCGQENVIVHVVDYVCLCDACTGETISSYVVKCNCGQYVFLYRTQANMVRLSRVMHAAMRAPDGELGKVVHAVEVKNPSVMVVDQCPGCGKDAAERLKRWREFKNVEIRSTS